MPTSLPVYYDNVNLTLNWPRSSWLKYLPKYPIVAKYTPTISLGTNFGGLAVRDNYASTCHFPSNWFRTKCQCPTQPQMLKDPSRISMSLNFAIFSLFSIVSHFSSSQCHFRIGIHPQCIRRQNTGIWQKHIQLRVLTKTQKGKKGDVLAHHFPLGDSNCGPAFASCPSAPSQGWDEGHCVTIGVPLLHGP